MVSFNSNIVFINMPAFVDLIINGNMMPLSEKIFIMNSVNLDNIPDMRLILDVQD